MDLVELLRIMVRRWWVTLPVLIVTFLAAVASQSEVPGEFEVSGSVLIAIPGLDSSRVPLSIADVPSAITKVSDDETARRTVEAGGTAEYQVRRVGSRRIEVLVDDSGIAGSSTAEFILEELSTILIDAQEAEQLPGDEQLVFASNIFEADGGLQAGGFDAEVREGTTLGVLEIYDPAADFVNPYEAGVGTAQLLEFAARSDEARRQMVSLVGFEDIAFNVATEGQGILTIAALAPTPDAALVLFEGLTQFLAEDLETRQQRAGVPSTRALQIEVLAEAQVVRDASPPVNRIAAAVVALGGLAAVGLVLLVENLAPRVSRRLNLSALQSWFDPRAASGQNWLSRGLRARSVKPGADSAQPGDVRAETKASARSSDDPVSDALPREDDTKSGRAEIDADSGESSMRKGRFRGRRASQDRARAEELTADDGFRD